MRVSICPSGPGSRRSAPRQEASKTPSIAMVKILALTTFALMQGLHPTASQSKIARYMPLTMQVRASLFGLFGSILLSAWIRAGAVALGGDAYGLDLTAIAVLLAFSIGAAIGSQQAQSTRTRWWPFFAVFGMGAGTIAFALPFFAASFQGLYHALGASVLAWLVSLLAIFACALLPWGCAGIALARLSSGADGQIVIPMSFGAAAGIFFLDRLAGPIVGGFVPLLVGSLGMCALAVGHDAATPLIHRRRSSVLRPVVFAGMTGVLLGIAGKSGFLLLLQFFPGSRPEIAWIQVLFAAGVAVGALGFGGPASLAKNPLLWTWFFVGFVGIALGISLSIASFLQEPANYIYYLGAFRAAEGSLFQGFLLFMAMASLPAIALGAALRCLANPAAEPSRPSVAACASALGIGLAGGIWTASEIAIPQTGIAGTLKIALVLLIGLGTLGVLLAGGPGAPGKGIAVGSFALGFLFVLPTLPDSIEVRNAYAPGAIAVREKVEGADGIAQATLESGRLTELWWNRNPLRANEEAIEKLEIAITALLAQGPDRALCLSAMTPSRQNWLRAAGISQIDLCPSSALLGKLSVQSGTDRENNPNVFRALAGVPKQYPLLLAFPEPLWPANVSSRWSEQGLAALREKLTENGCLVLWLRPRECSGAALREIARSFAEVFPSVEASVAFSGFLGPSLALVGRKQENKRASIDVRTEEVLRRLRTQPAFAALPLVDAKEIEGLQIARRDRILETTAGSARHWGPFSRVSWDLRPRFRPEQQSEGLDFLLALSTRASSAQENDNASNRLASLRLTLMGFIERLRRQPATEGWIESMEKGDLVASELQRFLEALEANPRFTPVLRLWEALGESALVEGNEAIAAPFLEKAAALAPHHGPLRYFLGRAYQTLRSDRALPSLQKAAELEPALASRWHYLGSELLRTSDLRGAAKSLEKSRELDPANAANLAMLALCYKELGDSQRARETLEAARAIAPENPKVREAVEKFR